jgi:hypothetical protein
VTGLQNSLPKVEAFLSALSEQSFFKDESTQGSVLWYIDFYKKRGPSRRLAFRAGGFILLFLSISLPFLTQLDGTRLLVEAVTAYRNALTVYTKEQLPQHWATIQNNLGNVLSERGTRTSGETHWAITKNNLVRSLRNLRNGGEATDDGLN